MIRSIVNTLVFILLFSCGAEAQTQIILGENRSPEEQFIFQSDTCKSEPFSLPIQLEWSNTEPFEIGIHRILPDTLSGFLHFEPDTGKSLHFDLIFSFKDSLLKPLEMGSTLPEVPLATRDTPFILESQKDSIYWKDFCKLDPDSAFFMGEDQLFNYKGESGCKGVLSDYEFDRLFQQFSEIPRFNQQKLALVETLFKNKCLQFDQLRSLISIFEYDDYKFKTIELLHQNIFETDSLEHLDELVFSKYYKTKIETFKP